MKTHCSRIFFNYAIHSHPIDNFMTTSSITIYSKLLEYSILSIESKLGFASTKAQT